jgi:MFS family permease
LAADLVPPEPASLLATRCGKLLLLLLCAVQFLDVVDSSTMNVALPSIRRDLGFSAQGLQWVLSGYLVTCGGLLLLGDRADGLLGRRPLLVAGTALFVAPMWRSACWCFSALGRLHATVVAPPDG